MGICKETTEVDILLQKKTIEDIDITGNNVVSAILEKFPFLDNEACVSCIYFFTLLYLLRNRQNKAIAIK